jgi:hypothetical protein
MPNINRKMVSRELRQYQMLQAKFDPQYANHLKGK